MRRVTTALLILSVLSLSACSYGTDFVVVNDSGVPIEVRYRIKEQESGDPLSLAGAPAKVLASQLGSSGSRWRELTFGEYQIDRAGRAVMVRLMPGEALRVAVLSDYDYYDASRQAEMFLFEEVVVAGADGEMKLTGDQARKAFTRESAQLYAIRYK